jgi:HEAT repeat protein
MTSYWHTSLWASGLLVWLACPALAPAADDPVLRGKPLSEWVRLLEQGGPVQRKGAARVLQEAGPVAAPAVPALVKAIKEDKVDGVRAASVKVLQGIGPDAKEAVLVLADALSDKTLEVKLNAADALGAIGPAAKDATPALIAGMNTPGMCRSCVMALGAIGYASNEVLAALKGEFEKWVFNKSTCPAPFTLRALGGLGKPAVPILIDAALRLAAGTDGNGRGFHPDVYMTALASLAKIGPDAKEAVPDLIKLLGHQRFNYRQKAAVTLGVIGPAAKDALPILERMRREDKDAGQAAADAIKKIGTP